MPCLCLFKSQIVNKVAYLVFCNHVCIFPHTISLSRLIGLIHRWLLDLYLDLCPHQPCYKVDQLQNVSVKYVTIIHIQVYMFMLIHLYDLARVIILNAT